MNRFRLAGQMEEWRLQEDGYELVVMFHQCYDNNESFAIFNIVKDGKIVKQDSMQTESRNEIMKFGRRMLEEFIDSRNHEEELLPCCCGHAAKVCESTCDGETSYYITCGTNTPVHYPTYSSRADAIYMWNKICELTSMKN